MDESRHTPRAMLDFFVNIFFSNLNQCSASGLFFSLFGGGRRVISTWEGHFVMFILQCSDLVYDV